MKESVFRKKSIDRISSPEEIDDYIKVTGPGMWLVLVVMILLLLAAVIWIVTGNFSAFGGSL